MRLGRRPRGLGLRKGLQMAYPSLGWASFLSVHSSHLTCFAVRSAAFAPLQLQISELTDAVPLLQVEDTAEDVGSKAEGTADDASKKLQGKARCALHPALLAQRHTAGSP